MIKSFVALLVVLIPIITSAQIKLVRTPQNVQVNKILPGGILPYGAAMPATFSASPTDGEIYRVHFFEEPLVAMTSVAAVPEENIDLVFALSGYSQRKSPDDFSAIVSFIQSHPKSRWNGALLANLGLVYRRTGYYNQALEAWEKSWALMKRERDVKVKKLADRVISELLMMYGWTGRAAKSEELLKETADRVITGSPRERIVAAKSSLGLMKTKPEISFKCGPYALNNVYSRQDSAHRNSLKLLDAKSPSTGFSLLQLERLAQDVGLNYHMAFRKPGSPVIKNAVVHWKLDHYSALINSDSSHIECEDATIGTVYGQQFWLTKAALDSSASGYFLIPQGPLPKGWRSVSASEGNGIFGKGLVDSDRGKHLLGCGDLQLSTSTSCSSCSSSSVGGGMAQSNVHAGAVSLHIFDNPVYYTPPKGPSVDWRVDYHHRDSYQPSNFSYSNMGPLWTFSWLSYVQDNPNYNGANADVYMMGGGDLTFTGFNYASNTYAPELQTNNVLVRVCDNCYELRHTDGSKEVYARPDGNTSNGRKIFLTQAIDAAGNASTISYDDLLRIKAIQDALGQVTTVSYENSADPYKVTKVTNPFGQSATFDYDDEGRLQKITGMSGIASSFHYTDGNFIDEMTTPYGITSFIKTESGRYNRSLETHFPMGEKERVEFTDFVIDRSEEITPSPDSMHIYNDYLYNRNTFFWDKKAMQEAPGDYKKARIYHWQHGSYATDENNFIAPILESEKKPLENRVWYDYQGQAEKAKVNQGMSSHPSVIARIMDDNTVQYTHFTYNELGKMTSSRDPTNRSFTYTYDSSQINLLEVRQTTNGANELLAQYTYNEHHQPLTAKDASGQINTFTYNDAGQLLAVTNPRKEKTTFTYDGNGYLKTVSGPVSGTTYGFDYDGFGRIRTVTDPEGYTVANDFDSLNRPTVVTYPDSTYEQVVYDRLDPVKTRDRLGRWTETTYDSLNRPNTIKDALGRITKLVWCNCGSLEKIIDPLNHATTFTRDLQGRLTAKTYHDGKSSTYAYEATTSRLKETTDAKGQKTQYEYEIDNNVKQITYAKALVPTPSVSYTYDLNYGRVATMTDGTGTTTYGYNPIGNSATLGAGQLASIDGPLDNDVITYSYDSLGRVNGRGINGIASSVAFDALGRITSNTNALGSFGYAYINQTDRLAAIKMPNGLSTVFDYYDNKGDQRLKQIWNKAASGATISKFDYVYNPQGQITKWTQQAGTNPPTFYELGYDPADQLVSAVRKMDRPAAILKQFGYKYDVAGNRLIEHVNNDVTVSQYNALNQLTKRWDADSLRSNSTFPIFPVVHGPGNGADTILQSPVTTVPPFTDYVDTSRVNDTLAYDDNGNLVSSLDVKYGWDALDRLISITKGTNKTEFIYDGLSRRVAEKLNGVVIKRWLWDGAQLAEERDATGATVIKRFFGQGEQISGRNYYFFIDHLGSVREMFDSNGAVQARYDYDPYGRRIKVSGNLEADFGFTGHYYHVSSGLYLSLYRAYDARLGRWLSRDPIKEEGGLNLYAYVVNNPITNLDHLGLKVYPADYNGKIGPNDCYSNIPTAPPGVDIDENIKLAETLLFWPPWYKELVNYDGPWDYKTSGPQYENFGNFHYGATASAFGFPDYIILKEAGNHQIIHRKLLGKEIIKSWGDPGWVFVPWGGTPPYGDQPHDQYWIKKGIEYYKNNKKKKLSCTCEGK